MKFNGPARSLQDGDVKTIAGYLGCQVAAVRAVLQIEAAGKPAPQEQQQPGPGITFAKVADSITKAQDVDVLDVAADLIGEVADEQQRHELNEIYNKRRAELAGE